MKRWATAVGQKCTGIQSAMKDYIASGVNSVFEIGNIPANCLSVVWSLICVRVCFGASYAETIWMEYSVWLAVAVACLVRLVRQKKLFTNETRDLFLLFAVLIVIMAAGLIQNFSMQGIKAIISAVCVYCFISELLNGTKLVQIGYFRIFYHVALGALLVYTVSGMSLGNTIPGCIVFLTCCYLIAEYSNEKAAGLALIKQNPVKTIHMLFCVLLAFAISWISGARTASFVLLIVGMVFLLFLLLKQKHFNIMFWVACWGAISFFLICIFIRRIPFYEELDRLSNIWFGKNLDSSRSKLWQESIAELSWWQIIVGKGTGILPSVEGYTNSSFHNSYLQLVMQNGVLGLLCLLAVLRMFWVRLAKYADDLVIRLVLASVVGVMIYNCFETTLLQNKTFLGFVQWVIPVLGLIRCRYIRKLKKVGKYG